MRLHGGRTPPAVPRVPFPAPTQVNARAGDGLHPPDLQRRAAVPLPHHRRRVYPGVPGDRDRHLAPRGAIIEVVAQLADQRGLPTAWWSIMVPSLSRERWIPGLTAAASSSSSFARATGGESLHRKLSQPLLG